MNPVKEITPHQLLHNRLQLIGQGDHVVAVPAHAAADVQQQFGHVQQHRRDLVGNRFRRVEMAGIQAEQRLIFNGVPQIKFVRAHHIALRADAKELALNGVEVVGGIERPGEDLVQRILQALTRAKAVNGRVFVAIGNPDVGNGRRA